MAANSISCHTDSASLAMHDGLVADVIGHVVEQRATAELPRLRPPAVV